MCLNEASSYEPSGQARALFWAHNVQSLYAVISGSEILYSTLELLAFEVSTILYISTTLHRPSIRDISLTNIISYVTSTGIPLITLLMVGLLSKTTLKVNLKNS